MKSFFKKKREKFFKSTTLSEMILLIVVILMIIFKYMPDRMTETIYPKAPGVKFWGSPIQPWFL